MTPEHVKMARAGLGWSLRKLAREAGVVPNTVTNFEMGRPVRFSTLNRIRAVLEKAGVRFTVSAEGVGVHIDRSRI